MKIKISPAIQNMGKWIEGTEEFDYGLELRFMEKVYDEPSEGYGINGGRISKLEIRLGNEILANYDRGWDVEVTEEAKRFYESILAEFN